MTMRGWGGGLHLKQNYMWLKPIFGFNETYILYAKFSAFIDPRDNDCAINIWMTHWTNSASSPNFFQKNWDFYTIRSVYLCSDCMLNLSCNFNLITKICDFFLAAAIFKSLLLNMADTIITDIEFGTIHHDSSLEANSETCLCSSLNRYKT